MQTANTPTVDLDIVDFVEREIRLFKSFTFRRFFGASDGEDTQSLVTNKKGTTKSYDTKFQLQVAEPLVPRALMRASALARFGPGVVVDDHGHFAEGTLLASTDGFAGSAVDGFSPALFAHEATSTGSSHVGADLFTTDMSPTSRLSTIVKRAVPPRITCERRSIFTHSAAFTQPALNADGMLPNERGRLQVRVKAPTGPMPPCDTHGRPNLVFLIPRAGATVGIVAARGTHVMPRYELETVLQDEQRRFLVDCYGPSTDCLVAAARRASETIASTARTKPHLPVLEKGNHKGVAVNEEVRQRTTPFLARSSVTAVFVDSLHAPDVDTESVAAMERAKHPLYAVALEMDPLEFERLMDATARREAQRIRAEEGALRDAERKRQFDVGMRVKEGSTTEAPDFHATSPLRASLPMPVASPLVSPEPVVPLMARSTSPPSISKSAVQSRVRSGASTDGTGSAFLAVSPGLASDRTRTPSASSQHTSSDGRGAAELSGSMGTMTSTAGALTPPFPTARGVSLKPLVPVALQLLPNVESPAAVTLTFHPRDVQRAFVLVSSAILQERQRRIGELRKTCPRIELLRPMDDVCNGTWRSRRIFENQTLRPYDAAITATVEASKTAAGAALQALGTQGLAAVTQGAHMLTESPVARTVRSIVSIKSASASLCRTVDFSRASATPSLLSTSGQRMRLGEAYSTDVEEQAKRHRGFVVSLEKSAIGSMMNDAKTAVNVTSGFAASAAMRPGAVAKLSKPRTHSMEKANFRFDDPRDVQRSLHRYTYQVLALDHGAGGKNAASAAFSVRCLRDLSPPDAATAVGGRAWDSYGVLHPLH